MFHVMELDLLQFQFGERRVQEPPGGMMSQMYSALTPLGEGLAVKVMDVPGAWGDAGLGVMETEVTGV